jgi:cobalt-zinc-cadmium efflux system protein
VGIVMLFKDIHVLDPALSILITLYVLFNVIRNLKKTLRLFLQGVPENISIKELEDEIKQISGVQSVHHTHMWSLDGEHNVLTSHVVVEQSADKNGIMKIKKEIDEKIKHLSLEHTTIEIEYENEDCRLLNHTSLSSK